MKYFDVLIILPTKVGINPSVHILMENWTYLNKATISSKREVNSYFYQNH